MVSAGDSEMIGKDEIRRPDADRMKQQQLAAGTEQPDGQPQRRRTDDHAATAGRYVSTTRWRAESW